MIKPPKDRMMKAQQVKTRVPVHVRPSAAFPSREQPRRDGGAPSAKTFVVTR